MSKPKLSHLEYLEDEITKLEWYLSSKTSYVYENADTRMIFGNIKWDIIEPLHDRAVELINKDMKGKEINPNEIVDLLSDIAKTREEIDNLFRPHLLQ